jgi:hypothetical protein
MARKFTLQFPPTSFVGGDTNTPAYVQHASTTGRIALAFDGGSTTEGTITVPWVMPDTYVSGNMTLKLYFYTTTGVAAPDGLGIYWQVGFEKVIPNPDNSVAGDPLDLMGAQGIGAAVTHTHEMASSGTTAGELSVAAIPITNANADSCAAGDLMRFVVQREPSHDDDDYTSDVFLTCVELYQE